MLIHVHCTACDIISNGQGPFCHLTCAGEKELFKTRSEWTWFSQDQRKKAKNYVNLTPKIGNQDLVPLPTCSPQCLYLGEFHLWYGTQYQVIFWMCWGWNLKAVDLLIYFYAYNCNPQQLMSSTFWAQTVTLQLEIILFNMVHQPGTPHSLLDGACWIKEALDKSESSGRLCLNISSAKFDQACSAVGT